MEFSFGFIGKEAADAARSLTLEIRSVLAENQRRSNSDYGAEKAR
jgi:hypothetical protein